jgi:hypothetical protein
MIDKKALDIASSRSVNLLTINFNVPLIPLDSI